MTTILPNLHTEILTKAQVVLLPLIRDYYDNFALVGGTAIALYLGHRSSIDFDLMSQHEINANQIISLIKKHHQIQQTLIDNTSELTLLVEGVKLTFFSYPFEIQAPHDFQNTIRLPELLTLGAMKAYALGRRSKWKDYIDLYCILKKHNFRELIQATNNIYGDVFSEKLFREQLAYYNDIDYTEKVNFLEGFDTSDETIKKFLTEISLS